MADVLKCNDSKRGLFAHDERNLNNPVKFRKNYEIDSARTHLNYDVISGATAETAQRGDLEKRLEARLAQLTIRKRRENTVTFGSWVVTLPRELKEAPQEQQREFFRHTVEFVQNRYGKDNVLGAWVHNDETTPHVHIKFVPEERKKTFDADGKDVTDYNRHEGTGVLLAKDIFKRGEYQTFHRDLQRHLEQRMGMKLSILNGATKARGKNASIPELKAETALQEEVTREALQRVKEQAEELLEAAQELAEEVAEGKEQAEALTKEADRIAKRLERGADKMDDLAYDYEPEVPDDEGFGGWLVNAPLRALSSRKAASKEKQASFAREQAHAVRGMVGTHRKAIEQAQETAKSITEAAASLKAAAALVPDYAKTGEALAAAMAAAARTKREAEEQKQRNAREKRQNDAHISEQAAKLADVLVRQRWHQLQQHVEGLESRAAAAELRAQMAEPLKQEAMQAASDKEAAEKARDKAQKAEKEAWDSRNLWERQRDEFKADAEQWRRSGRPASRLQDALQAVTESHGRQAMVQAVNAFLKGGDAAQTLDMLEQQQQQQRAQQAAQQRRQVPQQARPRSGPGLGM